MNYSPTISIFDFALFFGKYEDLLGNMKKEKATTEEELDQNERQSWLKVRKDGVVHRLNRGI